jgi:hypothetical protein
MPSCGAGSALEPYSVFATAAYSVSLTSVDLPEPETPVTQTRSPSGSSRSTLFRLWPRAPRTTMRLLPGRLRNRGTSILSVPER